MSEKTYRVQGMTCGHCVQAVTTEVSAIPGVTAAEVDLAAGTVTVTGDNYTDEQVAAAVDEAGFDMAE